LRDAAPEDLAEWRLIGRSVGIHAATPLVDGLRIKRRASERPRCAALRCAAACPGRHRAPRHRRGPGPAPIGAVTLESASRPVARPPFEMSDRQDLDLVRGDFAVDDRVRKAAHQDKARPGSQCPTLRRFEDLQAATGSLLGRRRRTISKEAGTIRSQPSPGRYPRR
jgi:hypothetical protein